MICERLRLGVLYAQTMQSALQDIERMTPLTRALEVVQPGVNALLTATLQQGLADYLEADRNEVWNVTAQFWPASCRFTSTDREGRPSVGQDCFSSELVVLGDPSGILRMVEQGHASVMVLISLVPYLRAGQELSVHALASQLLEEAARVIHLGLPAQEDTQVLLRAWHEGDSPNSGALVDTAQYQLDTGLECDAKV